MAADEPRVGLLADHVFVGRIGCHGGSKVVNLAVVVGNVPLRGLVVVVIGPVSREDVHLGGERHHETDGRDVVRGPQGGEELLVVVLAHFRVVHAHVAVHVAAFLHIQREGLAR